MEFSAQQIAALLGGKLIGNAEAKVSDVAPIEQAQAQHLSFITEEKYMPFLKTSKAGVILMTASLTDRYTDRLQSTDQALILVENARGAMGQLLTIVSKAMNPPKRGVEQPCSIAEGVVVPEDAYIGAFVSIGKNVCLGKRVQIYPQVFIGDDVEIGDNTVLYAGVKIYHHCRVGADCILHAGAVIGADGFGFEPDAQGLNQKIPQIGNVIIEDDVEIGANTTIDRAMMGSTIIRKNAKIDNLVQIGHNVELGESSILCAQAGIAGSTKVGKHCVMAGQAGAAGHITITDNCIFGAQAGIAGNVRKPGMYLGSPAIDVSIFRRAAVRFKQSGEH